MTADAAHLRTLRALAATGASPQELAIHLAALGYDPERASALLDQLAHAPDEPARDASSDGAESSEQDRALEPRPAAEVEDPDSHGSALRVWAPFERARFSPDAWGQLLRLRADGMGDGEFEHLVDRALVQLDGPIGIADLRSMIGDVVDPATSPPTVH